jgi:hypothetical protein
LFKTILHSLGEELILDLEQIIPTKDAADYVISMADKTQEDLSAQSENQEWHKLRFEFWNLLLPRFKGKTLIYQGISPSKDHWSSSGLTGIAGLNYACLITRDHAGIELAINTEWKFVIVPRSFWSLNDFSSVLYGKILVSFIFAVRITKHQKKKTKPSLMKSINLKIK